MTNSPHSGAWGTRTTGSRREDKVRDLKDEVRRQERLAEEVKVAPFQNNNPETWAAEVWARLSDPQRYYFKEAIVKGSRHLRKKLVEKKEVLENLGPIASALNGASAELTQSTLARLGYALKKHLDGWRV